MALSIKFCKALSNQLLFKNNVYLYNGAKCYSDEQRLPWNYLWRPGVYSEEDHDKIAEKYHLHPKEYKPYPNNSASLGDYPALPWIGPAAKDPYYPYDIPVFRKNYHETLHDSFEIMGEDRFSYGVKDRINIYLGTAIFCLTIAILAGLVYLAEPYKVFQPRMEKQFPFKGKVHYTFEPAE